jgi:hypothetical protein
MKRKCLAIGIILLFIGVAVAPSINASPHQNIDTTTISVDFIGCNDKKSYSLEVSLSQALKIKKMLDSRTKALENATSEQESLSIIIKIFADLEAEGLIEKNDRARIIDFYQKLNDVGFSGKLPRVMQNKQNYTNIFAFLISHSDSSVYEFSLPLIVGSAIMYLGLYFWMANGNLLLAALCGIIGAPFLLLSVLMQYIPLKFWAIIDSESPIEIWSIGLKGYDHAEYPFAVLIGFKGIKISIPFTASYCIGHALAILTEPINPPGNVFIRNR